MVEGAQVVTNWDRLRRLAEALFYRRDKRREYQRLMFAVRRLRHQWAPDPDLVKAWEVMEAKYGEMDEAAERTRCTSMSGGGSSGSGPSDPTNAELMAAIRFDTLEDQIIQLIAEYTPRAGTHKPGRVSDAQLDARAAG